VPALKVVVVAGERSGDTLGAGLIGALGQLAPGASFFGIAGESMIAAGCEPWYHTEELSVMGLAEVLRHLPRLLRIRRTLIERLRDDPPDVFIGIDSPDFNLPVAATLRRSGVPTVQYVSPQVWAWRPSRVEGIRRATDRVLCVLPFETDFYAAHGVDAVYVGHPLADVIPLQVSAAEHRARLSLPLDRPLVAILPGSRRGEVSRLGRPFMETAAWLRRRRPELGFSVALASESIRDVFVRAAGEAIEPSAALIVGKTREVLAAADVVLTASGTASLEATLYKRPLAAAYRLSAPTYWALKSMGLPRLDHFSLPNLLAGRAVVPEFLQGQVRAERIGPALLRLLEGESAGTDWYDAFTAIHQQLRCNANVRAARAVLDLLHPSEALAVHEPR
jgi:lipid-A-disaccharide synthase